jgi:hypothetical protein
MMRALVLALSIVGIGLSGPALAQTEPPVQALPSPSSPPPQAQPRAPGIPGTVAILRGLDKITGQYRDFKAPVGQAVKFHTLTVTVRACQKSAPEEAPDAAVFLEVLDTPLPKKGQPAPTSSRIFSGWTFSSSPALNALEHPVYDVWAMDCR